MSLVQSYIVYVRNIKRYSERTLDVYTSILCDFSSYINDGSADVEDDVLLESLTVSIIRGYMMCLLDGNNSTSVKHSPRTVNLYLSVLSGFCQYLVKKSYLKSNPVRLVRRPKVEKRLPEFYRADDLGEYFNDTEYYASEDSLLVFKHAPDSKEGKTLYIKRLSRLIILMLYCLGVRRSELIDMKISDVDFSRKVVNVCGKGNKMREVPVVVSLIEEILLYLDAVEALVGGKRPSNESLLVNYSGSKLYPVYVDRVIKKELGESSRFTGRKSPHVLRHSLATDLLNEGANLNSIKELLGHSSLSATQVYTHNTVAKLKNIYESAHPRAKNGGKNGD